MKTCSTILRTTLVCLSLGAGCGTSDSASVTRIHLENASDSPITLIAVGLSEQDVERAANRLPKPLEPDSVYSAVLTRPGNYWVRAEFKEGGHTIERIEGPFRVSRGILDWRFTTLDVRPLYRDPHLDERGAGTALRSGGITLAQPAAGRMSFSSN